MAWSKAGSLAQGGHGLVGPLGPGVNATVADPRACSSSERTWRWVDRATACQP